MVPQTVLITGASRGIGAAIAEKFAMEGCHLALTCKKNLPALEALADRLHKQYGVVVSVCAADASDYQQCRQTVTDAISRLGQISVLVNNAGISHIGLFTDTTPLQWNRILQVNLTSAYNMCHLLVPHMLKNQRGAILNISSVWGQRGASCEVAYSSAKAGLDGFTRALGKELAPSNIPVNAIACGMIDTDMNKSLSQEELTELYKEIPAGRPGAPEEAARLAWQVINAPSYFTGQVITLDGGWM